jgi:hypothetical protein
MLYYLRLLYTALASTQWSRPEASRLFASNRATYHPITQHVIEQILSQSSHSAPKGT